MKCKKCGKYIKFVKCHIFSIYGDDNYLKLPIRKPKEKGTCYFIQAPIDCTMFEFDNYDEFIEQISCPECNEFPFVKGTSINIYKYADVVFGQEEKYTINGEREVEEDE